MDKRIEEILRELYAVDSGLRRHEESLKKIISGLLLSKDKISIDAEFVGGLRRKLLASAEVLKKQPKNAIINFNFMKKLNYALGGFAALALIAAGSVYLLQNRGNLAVEQKQLFSPDVQIASLGKGAFGSLASRDFTVARGMGGGGSPMGGSPMMGPESAGNSAADIANTALLAPSSSAPAGMGGGVGGGGFVPPMMQYKFVYAGDKFSVDQAEMPIFRRIKGLGSVDSAAQALKNLNFGVFNLKSFNNLMLQSLSFVEDRDFGYAFYVNLQEGTISISENWLRWGEGGRLCQGMTCAIPAPLGVSDMPDDQTVIKLAEEFLAAHGIALENYSEPMVQNFWSRDYEIIADKSQFYFPEILV